MYKVETHVHTSEVSGCARLTAEEQIRQYAREGFSTVFISDHFAYKRVASFDEGSWDGCIDRFMLGYKMAKAEGEKLGINVLFAAELNFPANPNHYLLYGDCETFLRNNEEAVKYGVEAFSKAAREQGLFVVQAHPYRDGSSFPHPDYVDGFEVINSSPRHENYDEKSIATAEEYGKYQIAGSDSHRDEDVAGAGVLSPREIKTSEDFIALIKSGEHKLYRRNDA